jgi:hypothetical protein
MSLMSFNPKNDVPMIHPLENTRAMENCSKIAQNANKACHINIVSDQRALV